MDTEHLLERIAAALERIAARPIVIDRAVTSEQADNIREYHAHLAFLFTNIREGTQPEQPAQYMG